MNQKYHEFAGKFLPVVSVSGIVALLIRLKLMDEKPDAFFFNVMFVLMISLLMTMYSHIILIGSEIIEIIKRLFRKRSKKVNQILFKDERVLEIDNNVIEDKEIQILKVGNSSDVNKSQSLNYYQDLKFDNQAIHSGQNNNLQIEIADIQKIREDQENVKKIETQKQINIAIEYVKKQFVHYMSNEDIKILCNNIINYVQSENFQLLEPVKTENLVTQDLEHFGWNIYNHSLIKNTYNAAKFIKLVFADDMMDVEILSIKSHLKTSPKKGKIKIEYDLAKYFENNYK